MTLRQTIATVAMAGLSSLTIALGATSYAQNIAASPAAITTSMDNVLESFLLPGYERMADQAVLTQESIAALCAAPDESTLEQARTEYQALVKATQRMSMIHFGPIMRENRIDRLLFWPDRSGIALKQVQGALAKQDPALLDVDKLYAQSVGLQGLLTLEFALFGSGSDAELLVPESYRCAFGEQVSELIVNLTRVVYQEWAADYANHWRNPGADNPHYRDQSEVLAEVVSMLANGYADFRDMRVLSFWSDNPNKRNPKKAIFYRSGSTVIAQQAAMEGFHRAFDAAAIETLLPEDERWIVRSIQLELDNMDRLFASIELPTAEALADKTQQDKWVYSLILTRSLQGLLGEQLAAKLGFALNFSPSDGD